MAKTTTEDIFIETIENGIRAIRLGTKTPAEAKVGYSLNRLKALNPGMHDELMKQYKNVIQSHNTK